MDELGVDGLELADGVSQRHAHDLTALEGHHLAEGAVVPKTGNLADYSASLQPTGSIALV